MILLFYGTRSQQCLNMTDQRLEAKWRRGVCTFLNMIQNSATLPRTNCSTSYKSSDQTVRVLHQEALASIL